MSGVKKLKTSRQPCCPDHRTVTVLDAKKWNELKQYIPSDESNLGTLESRSKKEEEALYALSKSMSKHWTNTFLGSRQRKLDERKKRLEAEEEAKKEIDIGEAKLQAERRGEAILEASLKLYYQTDRMKKFNTGLGLSEVNRERDLQLELKKLQNMAQESKEQAFVERWRKQLAQAELMEKEKDLQRHQNREKNRDDVIAQITDRASSKQSAYDSKMREERELLDAIAKDEEEERNMELQCREKKQQMREEQQSAISNKEKYHTLLDLREKEEDKRRKLYALAKIKLTQQRVKRERAIMSDRLTARDQARDHMLKLMKDNEESNDDEERLQQVLAEKEAKYQEQEARKAEARLQRQKECADHRIEQMAIRANQRESERNADLDEAKQWKEAEAALEQVEKVCAERKMADFMALNREYMIKKAEKDRARELEREDEIQRVKQGTDLTGVEDGIFKDYTQRVIEHSKKNGRNTYPLEMAVYKTSKY